MTIKLSKWMTLALLVVIAAAMPAPLRAADAAPSTKPDESGGPLKFYGSITAVDPKAMTFTVDNVTYSIVGETQMTKAEDGSQATIADATVGQPARGSFTKSSDGKLNVTKVRFGRKAGGKAAGGKSGGKKKNAATTQSSDQ